MKKAYGFPVFQPTKEELEAKRQAQKALTNTAHWSKEALPFAYCWACVEIAITRSHEADIAYSEAVKALELPGCQALLTDMRSSFSIMAEGIKAGAKLPNSILKLNVDYRDNDEYDAYVEKVCNFIRLGFNREIDRENERPKVVPGKAGLLFSAIIIRSVADHCKVALENWNQYRPDEVNATMTNPTTRGQRLRKPEYKQLYKRLKWVLVHNSRLLADADQWYQCRVNPGTIEAYLDIAAPLKENGLERSNVSKALAPYDEATGYPRKWRK